MTKKGMHQLCESCNTREITIEENVGESQYPCRLCEACHRRFLNQALRPLEFFNLMAIHGYGNYYLHDDFYDYHTGIAEQPEIEVTDAESYPFPQLDDIKADLKTLTNYACVQYDTSEEVADLLKQFDQQELLQYLDEKVKYNRNINYKSYEIAGKVLGRTAENWIKEEWKNRQEGELHFFAEPMSHCLLPEEAFALLTAAINAGGDQQLADNCGALIYLQSPQTLEWIEQTAYKIVNVSDTWGMLAAASKFSWSRAEKWLTLGRPLSLIALDALIYCTTVGYRSNQAFWLQQHPPLLIDAAEPEIITDRLRNYLSTDNVPRTRNAVDKTIQNLAKIPQ